MSRPHRILPASVLLALGLLAGCSRTPTVIPKPQDAKLGEDRLDQARELVRRATDIDGYRSALNRVNEHLAEHPTALDRYQSTAKERDALLKGLKVLKGHKAGEGSGLDETGLYRQLLVRVGLEEDELQDVEAPRFGPLDAHYLEFCAILRDAARWLRLQEQTNQGPDQASARLGQVRQAFAWVMRQVALEEKPGNLEPPPFTLRRGRGGSRERTLIFLTLLQQMGLEGCAVALPDKGEMRYPLAGVLLKDGEQAQIYLFDPRLGIPLPAPDGKGVATLAQFRQQPAKILAALNLDKEYRYDIDEKQAAQAQVQLVLPLPALSARMRFLEEEVFGAHDRVGLALRPEYLLARFAEATGGEVGVWNERAIPGKGLPISPTRVLRLSLPPDQGGVDKDKPNRHERHLSGLMPWAPVQAVLEEMQIPQELPQLAGHAQVAGYAYDLFRKYVQAPREQLVRGRTEQAAERLGRLQVAVGQYEDDLARQGGDREFAQKLKDWRKEVQVAVREKERGSTRQWNAVWGEDEYLSSLLALGEDARDRRKLRTGFLGVVVFRAAGEPLRREAAYLLALRLHEEARKSQARVDTATGGKVGPKRAAETAGAWKTAQERWARYADEYRLTPASIEGRLRLVLRPINIGAPQGVQGLLDSLFHDLRSSVLARLREAEAASYLGQSKEARAALEAVLQQADAIGSAPALQKLRQSLDAAPAVDAILFGDLAERGSFFWLRYRARLELAKLNP